MAKKAPSKKAAKVAKKKPAPGKKPARAVTGKPSASAPELHGTKTGRYDGTKSQPSNTPKREPAKPNKGNGGNNGRTRNPDSEPGIRRLDSPAGADKQTHGFQVCIPTAAGAHTKMFSDSKNGGKEGARKAARLYLAEMNK